MPVTMSFHLINPLVDVNAKTPDDAYGAKESLEMDFSDVDRAPMRSLNEIIWKSVKGKDSVMPSPVHRYRPLIDFNESGHGGTDDND
jgi:hypothetical protein